VSFAQISQKSLESSVSYLCLYSRRFTISANLQRCELANLEIAHAYLLQSNLGWAACLLHFFTM